MRVHSVNSPDNQERAERAHQAVALYQSLTGGDEDETSLADLLADLRHWADEEGIDYAEADQRGEGHYNHEKREG